MKKPIFVLAFAAVAALPFAGCQTDDAAKKGEKEPLRVLMVGNSFSISCLTYLPQVAAECGKKLDLGSLYIGGCSLEQHVGNLLKERAAGMKGVKGAYLYDRVSPDGKRKTLRNMRLTDALKEAKWDVVTIQQASHLSWDGDSYHPWGDELVNAIREYAPTARILVQETWSYTPFDKRLKEWEMTPDEMYDRLKAAYADFARGYEFDVVRMGDAVQEWRKRLPVEYEDNSFGGDVVGGRNQKPENQFKRNADLTWSVNSDPFHLNAKGEYLQALVWAATLFKTDLSKVEVRPAGVTDKEDRLLRLVAREVTSK